MTGGAALLRGPRVSHPAPHGIPGLFRDQRRRTPGAVACADPERSLTYTELDRLSDTAAAAVLHATGGRRGAVALRMPRGCDLLVALLGVLKAGCHYVPVATDEPAGRVAVMMDVVRPLCTLVAAGQEGLAPAGPPAVVVPRTVPYGDGERDPAPLRAVAPDDPVYALFTSGSTGAPKAVLVGAAALSNRILWMAAEFGVDAHDRVLQKTPYTFDVAGWEFFLPLVTGAACVFAPVDAHYDARAIGAVIAREAVTVCHFVPTMLESYLRLAPAGQDTSLRLVFCSGEPLPAALAARFSARLDARLHNLYGPTEAAIDVTHWPVPPDIAPDDAVYIGAPVDNTDLRVLDAGGAPVADGAPGELWIGGVQVALGYVGRPDLTDAAFTVRDGLRWYRTGDLVTVEDGLIRYRGRTDAQLKIRGVRVEPGEVEAVLEAHPAVGRAAVVPVASRDGSGAELVAVAVAAAGRAGGAGGGDADDAGREVLAFTAERLPRTFVPRAVRWVDRLPLTTSGKADRRRIAEEAEQWWATALPAAAAGGAGHPADAGDDLARAWWEALPTPSGARRDDLGFLTLGGHSLAATTLLARLAATHEADVPLAALLRDDMSLAGLRELVAGAPNSRGPEGSSGGAAGPAAPAATPRDRSPLTPAQEPLWLVNRALADDSGNNVVGALSVPAEIVAETLRTAVGDVLARHDLLRAAVRVESGVPHWSYAPHADAALVTRQVTGPVDQGAIGGFVAEIAKRPVPLDRPPLMTVGLLRGPAQSVLAVSLHHLVADQRALELVVADIAAAYSARTRGAAPHWPSDAPNFADFAHLRAASVGSPSWHADLAHWERLLGDAPVRTALPFRLRGPSVPTLDGRRRTAAFGAAASATVDAFLADSGHTRATYFLACVATVLAAWSGEESVAVGMPVSRRVRPPEVDLVGLALSTVPLWLAAGEQADRETLLRHVRDRTLDALDHATPTFQAIAHRLGLPPSPRDNPLFQVWFNDLSRIGPAPVLAGAPAHWLDAAPPAALFDLNFYLRYGEDGYRLELICRDGLYDDAVVGELLRQVADTARRFAAIPSPPPAPEAGPDAAPRPTPALGLAPAPVAAPGSWPPAAPGDGAGFAPRPAPALGPAPALVPDLAPSPAPAASSESVPSAAPALVPAAAPEPAPGLVPEPAPAPVPEPVLALVPEPASGVEPEQVSGAASGPAAGLAPEPAPGLESVPAPVPEPSPGTAPAPVPEPVLALVPEPASGVEPEAASGLLPAPVPAPVTGPPPGPEPEPSSGLEPAPAPGTAPAPGLEPVLALVPEPASGATPEAASGLLPAPVPAPETGPPPGPELEPSSGLEPAPAPAAPARSAPGVLAQIRAAAAARPDAVAVAVAGGGGGGHGGSRTYAQLVADCARVAAEVRAAGVGAGGVVELRAGRTPDLPAALLGAWAAGAVVAVVDAGLPDAVLGEQHTLLRPAAVWATGRGEPPAPVTDPAPRPLPGIGHVLFTSGTSGRPAAVQVPSDSLAATLHWYVRAYGFTASDRVAMLGGIGHDPLLRDILAPLTVGGTVVVPPQDVFAAPDRLFALLREERVTVLHATPALLEMILAAAHGPAHAALADLRLVVSAGAPLTAGLVRELRDVTAAPVVNGYGATETPQLASVQEVAAAGALPPAALPDESVLPVGSGAGGAELLVLRPDGTPAPVGQAGEIVVRSPHLAAGYLAGSGRAGAFTAAGGPAFRGGAAFRTGDRGRRDPSGAVVPDGRLDRQVSVDGHRLDPEQVERVALGHPGVHRALVRLLPTAAGPALSLSVVAHPGADAPVVAELRSHLRRRLPRWAVPTELRVVDAFAPGARRKAAGRHAAIPAPRAPRDTPGAASLAEEIARLLRGIVGADVPPGENFFDAGLNSMALVRLHALLCERLAVDFPVTAMFEHPHVTALARFLADGPRPVPLREVRHHPRDGEGAHQRRQLRQRIRRDLDRGQA
ncbi:amino acid adenylation domain-containing protein [Streptomyces sp. V4-01]|uniref:Amino acid adenylation domain-containing protein n=1 Tax=Actinacidiphila polyblastidii TaxID=3110430 RepID=A0ABU7P9H3_9ACTN|nr:amino acid adenylation domain-containing protein [Streptomyces sp. V4-01]